ncbi:MAG: hypothetical protein IJ137_05760 [Eubacterium sp.]|nr:hypothetical protein [Eubacterium sp.]
MNTLTAQLNQMLMGEDLQIAMSSFPSCVTDRDLSGMAEGSPAERISKVSSLAELYLPSQMSYEIYSKLYMGVFRSLEKKTTIDAIRQKNRNFLSIDGRKGAGVLGGSDSFTVIGPSGIGKSSAVIQAAINHIGLLVIDEIQNICNNRNGVNLVSCLTQLINNSGTSLCMVGLPETESFFSGEMQLVRRSIGLSYKPLPYEGYFQEFCRALWNYQFTLSRTVMTDGILEWLYEHSAGIISIVLSLIKEAQEIAILSGGEILNIRTLEQAYAQRLGLLQHYLAPFIRKKGRPVLFPVIIRKTSRFQIQLVVQPRETYSKLCI